MTEIIVAFPTLTEEEKEKVRKQVHGYEGELLRCKECEYWTQVPWLPSHRRVCAKTNNVKQPYGYCDEAETKRENDFQQYLDDIGVRES